MEYRKAGDTRTARELFKKALQVDPKCSAAWMQLGVMEVDCENWEEAQLCFDTVLKFDQRNSRVLQAYALMETKRPDGNSRKAIGLFERALKANRRDAGVLQAYALYVAELGDIDAARELLQRGTEVNKRHAPVWQAWGVLETRYGNAEDARNLFQQGIWACGQLTGSQSGGYHCARLWQAWGVLEAKEGQYAAARRCFSRALDANSRNVPAVTAWAQMEEKLGNHEDARMIYERALGRFAAGSDDKMSLWRSYELMEERHGDRDAAQAVYRRATKETIGIRDDATDQSASRHKSPSVDAMKEVLTKTEEVEVVRWQSSGGEVWMNGKEIESKLPYNMKKRQPRP
jgi:tetratricopeptide (TPR) repeat protein